MKGKKGFSLAECVVAMAIIVMFSGLVTTVCLLAVKSQQTATFQVESRNVAEQISVCFIETYKTCGKSDSEDDKKFFYETFNDNISKIVGAENLNGITDLSHFDGAFKGGQTQIRCGNTLFFGESQNDNYRTFSFLYKYTTKDYVVKFQMNIRTGTYTTSTTTSALDGKVAWYSAREEY